MLFRPRNTRWQLKDGARIGIIGAGPAGCFFALHALSLAHQRGLTLDITLFDAKNFLLTGPPGCNLCAGVISENLHQLLQDHGIELKSPKVQWRIEGYYLQTPLLGVQLHHPNWRQNIYSVFRGNGPRFSSPEQNVSFDDLLLQHVIRLGARHKAELVVDVHLPKNPGDPALIETQHTGKKKIYKVDLVVGAFGLNSHLIQQFARKSRYSPPRIVATFQAEFPLPQDWIEKRFRGNIVVFSFPSHRTRYVVVVPKRGYLSISVINRRDAEKVDLDRFLRSPLFREYLPPGNTATGAQFCICKPRIAVSCSRHPYAHRMVIQYLIKEDILKVPTTTQDSNSDLNNIPVWIKNNAEWWAAGKIDDASFVNAMQFLIKEGIVRIL